MKQFCPSCEKDTECEHAAELYECKECGEDFAKYIVSRKPANSDVSMTQDVLTDIKTPQSIENTNPDYYKDEIKVLLDDLIRDARDYEEALNIGRGISGAAYACNMSREKLRIWMTKAAVAMKSKDIVIASQQKTINELVEKALGNSKLKELSDRFYLLLVDNPDTKLLADKIMSDIYGKD